MPVTLANTCNLRFLNTILLSVSVRQGYPDETGYVNGKEDEIMKMWQDLQDKAKERKEKLEDAGEKQKFLDQMKSLVSQPIDLFL